MGGAPLEIPGQPGKCPGHFGAAGKYDRENNIFSRSGGINLTMNERVIHLNDCYL